MNEEREFTALERSKILTLAKSAYFELGGMRRDGRSANVLLKEFLNIKGSRRMVIEQAIDIYDKAEKKHRDERREAWPDHWKDVKFL